MPGRVNFSLSRFVLDPAVHGHTLPFTLGGKQWEEGPEVEDDNEMRSVENVRA